MKAVFLSASVPVPGRGTFYENADPFLIHNAVREFVLTALGRRLIVWGGHPAITPMIWAACEDLGVDYTKAVLLYQSAFFKNVFPKEVTKFKNVIVTDAVPGDRNASLEKMRHAMLSRTDIVAGVFIGGMDGVEAEFALLHEYHPTAKFIAVASPGGAARDLANRLNENNDVNDIDYPRMFYRGLDLSPATKRSQT